MALYQPPEGFQYDPNTGYYYKQVIAQNDAGQTMQVVTWFNADTGKYRQDTYPVTGASTQASKSTVEHARPVNVPRQQAPASGHGGLVTGLIIGGAVLTLLVSIAIVLIVRGRAGKDEVKDAAVKQEETVQNPAEETDITKAVTATPTPDVQAAEETEDPDKYKPADLLGGLGDTEAAEEEYGTDYVEGGDDFAEGQFLGMFIDADMDIPRAFAPVLVFKENYEFEMMLNFSEGTNMYYGEYYAESNGSTGETYLYLHDYGTTNGIPANATVKFSGNNYDYCEFLDEGFGLMGYSGAPYGFYRDTRE